MTNPSEIVAELAAKKKECEVAGCMDGLVRDEDCLKRHDELKNCMGNMKSVMQTKSHYIWEIVKIVAIPLITVIFMWWGLFSGLQQKVQNLDDLVKKLDVLVLDLIKEKR